MTTSPIPPMTTPTSSPSALDRLFDALTRSPLRRSPAGTIGGVCAGAADYLGVSTRVVRILTAVSVLFGVGVPLYLLAWLVLPDQSGRLHLERALRHGAMASIVLLIAAALAVVPTEHDDHNVGFLWVVALGVAAAVLIRRRRPQDT